jgi:hypothetical protein
MRTDVETKMEINLTDIFTLTKDNKNRKRRSKKIKKNYKQEGGY